jgi:hypothetical protein
MANGETREFEMPSILPDYFAVYAATFETCVMRQLERG